MGHGEKLPGDPKELYIFSTEDLTLRDISKLYTGKKGCSYDNLMRRSAKEKWVEQREKHASKTQAATAKKLVQQVSSKKAGSLADINLEMIARTQHLLEITHQKLLQGIKTDDTGKTTVDIEAKDLRRLTQNVIHLHHEIRLYNNYWPTRPHEDDSGLTEDESQKVVEELFGDIFDDED